MKGNRFILFLIVALYFATGSSITTGTLPFTNFFNSDISVNVVILVQSTRRRCSEKTFYAYFSDEIDTVLHVYDPHQSRTRAYWLKIKHNLELELTGAYSIGICSVSTFPITVYYVHILDQNDNSTTEVARQFILPPRIRQMSLSGTASRNNPSLMVFNELPGETSEVTAQQVENQIDQLNQLSQQLRGLPQSPSIQETSKGQQIPLSSYVPQISRGALQSGLGRQLAVEPSFVRNIARNPLTGPNGLTKDVLSDLMFGNLKSLASMGGLSNANSPLEQNAMSPQMLGNSELSAFNNPLLEEKFAQSQSGKPGLGLPLPPNENMDFNDLPTNDLDNLKELSFLRSKHHSKSKRKKKNDKSDVVTKLLLTLLVDKLKDIYEMDKINSTQRKTLKLDSSTIGKIQNTLKERSHPPSNTKNHSEKDGEKEAKLPDNFDTNLSFPLTFSDTKGAQVSLVDSPQKSDNKDSSLLDVDTKNIENIIKGIENGSPEPKENSSVKIASVNADPGNSPLEISQKTTKTLNNDDLKLLQTGTASEFHRVKIDPVGEVGKSETIPSISDYHPTIDASKTAYPSQGIFEVHTDKATVSALPTFSISSLLNQEIPGNVKASGRVLNINAEKDVNNVGMDLTSSATAKPPGTSNAIEDTKGSTTSTGETDTANYLEASRVLGAVFNKVKDPLARKSVEVAIKAMLRLMKSDNTYSKKQSVPSIKSWILQEKVKKLMKTIHELSKTVHAVDEEVSSSRKTFRRVKHKILKRRFSHKHLNHHRPRHAHHHKRTYSKH